MKNKETFTIVRKGTGSHYDTNDQRFYVVSWERSQDSKSYLENLITMEPDKFKGCEIQNNAH